MDVSGCIRRHQAFALVPVLVLCGAGCSVRMRRPAWLLQLVILISITSPNSTFIEPEGNQSGNEWQASYRHIRRIHGYTGTL